MQRDIQQVQTCLSEIKHLILAVVGVHDRLWILPAPSCVCAGEQRQAAVRTSQRDIFRQFR